MPTNTPVKQLMDEEAQGPGIFVTHESNLNKSLSQTSAGQKLFSSKSKLAPSGSGEGSSTSDDEKIKGGTMELSDLAREAAKERRKQRKNIVGSFRLVELIPTTNTPHTGFRRKLSMPLTADNVIDKRAEQHFCDGVDATEHEDHNQAITCYSKAIGLKSDIIKYYVHRGEAFIRICDFQSAILNYKKACILEPDNEEYYSRLAFIYFLQGQCLFDEKLYSEALEAFSRAAEMKPDNVGYHTRSVACLAALQRHGECLALVNKRLEVETDNPDLFIMRARLHELFRNTTLCYYDLKDALTLDSSNTEASTLLDALESKAAECRKQAVQLHLQGKIKEALTKISVAIETNPSIPDFHVFRGALHRRMTDFNAAIDDFLLALDKTDHDETHLVYKDAQRQLLLTYNDFAVECFGKGYYEEAVVLLNKAIKGEKTEKGLYVNRGDCFFRQNELQFALADYQQALELDSDDWSIRCRLSVVHNEFGILEYYDRHYVESIEHFTTAVSYNPKIGQYYLSRARAKYMVEDNDGARTDVLMSLYLDPTNKEIISIFSRLFPGKSTTDVMQSRVGMAAAQAVESSIREAQPYYLGSGYDSTGSKANRHSRFASKAILPPILSEIKSCMEEQNFHINIIKCKKKSNKLVKTALSTRQNLRIKVPRVNSHMSDPGTSGNGPKFNKEATEERIPTRRLVRGPSKKALVFLQAS